MSIIFLLIVGLIAGFLASLIVKSHGSGIALNLVFGVVGAALGSWIFHLIGWSGVAGGNLLWSIFVATIGAVIVLLIYNAIIGRRYHQF